MQITWSLVAGGSETYALTLAANLDPRRYRVAICAVDQGGALEPEITRLGIPCAIMHRRQGIDLRLMWRLYRLFRQTHVDVIHTHHFNQLFYSLLGAKLVGARIIHTEHSIECYKKRRLRIALRLLSIFCHRITAIGSDGHRFLLEKVRIPARKLQVIHAGVDLAKFTETRAQARQALGFSEQDRIVTIVARLSPEKNHALLLAAFTDVIRRVPGARLLIVGDGTHRDAVQSEVHRLNLAAHVQMLGVRRDVPRILAASDLFVLSSDREGLPIAVLEAMAARRPVVATAVGDLPLIISDNQTGRLVPPHDPAALAAAIIDLLNDRPRANAMGQSARQFVEAHYTQRRMVARHEELYQ
jgi:glycosyltransferase involved in cell wall biosynthesis